MHLYVLLVTVGSCKCVNVSFWDVYFGDSIDSWYVFLWSFLLGREMNLLSAFQSSSDILITYTLYRVAVARWTFIFCVDTCVIMSLCYSICRLAAQVAKSQIVTYWASIINSNKELNLKFKFSQSFLQVLRKFMMSYLIFHVFPHSNGLSMAKQLWSLKYDCFPGFEQWNIHSRYVGSLQLT